MTRTFRLMHLRELRRQPLRAGLAVLAIGAGVALTVAVLVARSSLDQSVSGYNSAVGGPATVRVVSRYNHGGIDASLVPAIEHVDGVQAAVPLVLAVTQVDDRHGHDDFIAAIGADCRAEAIFGAHGCDPNALAAATDAQPPLIGAALRDVAGRDGVLHTDDGDRPIGNAPVSADLATVNRGLVAVYPLPVAQRLFARPNGLDAVFVIPKAGTSTATLQADLSAVAGPQNRVVLASDPGSSVDYVSSQLLPFLLLLSLFGLAVGAQLIYNTMSLSLEERRRELAIESAIGGTPATVVGGVLGEAALLGLAGGALGIGIGLLAARPFVDNLSQFAEQAAGIHLAVHPTALSIVAGLVMGLVASTAAAIVPARRAARLDIAGELVDRSRRADTSPRAHGRKAIASAALAATGLALAWRGSRNGGLESWQPAMLWIGVVLAFFASYPLTASLAPFVVRGLERIPRFQRGPVRLALSNLRTETRRTSAVLTAVTAAVATSFTLGSSLPGMLDGARTLAEANAAGRVIVTTLRPNNTAEIDSKLSPEIQARLSQLPGVERVEHNYWASFDQEGVGQIGIASTDGRPPRFEVFQGVGSDEATGRGQIMMGAGLARTLDLRPGDPYVIPGRSGPVSMIVGGIWAAPDELGKSITVPPDVFQRLAGSHPPNSVFLEPRAGVSVAQLADTVRAARLGDNIKVWDTEQLGAEFAHDFKAFMAPFWLLARGLLVVAFIATASTLLLAGVKRRREHGLLAAVGMPPGDLGRMVLVEAGLFGLLGTLSGFVGGVISVGGFALASTTLTGLTIPFHLTLTPLFLYGGIATLFVLVGAALPAWRTSRLDPVIALRYE